MFFFLQGLIIGFSSMAPIGMQNLFVINTALAQTTMRVLITVAIVIFFDMTLSLSAFFGMGALITQFPLLKLLVMFFGGLLIMYMGYQTVRTEPTISNVDTNVPITKIISTSFLVTWANPQALIDVTMMLGAFRASLSDSESYIFISGVMAAAIVWFGGLALVMRLLANKISISSLAWLNKICGTIILLYGIKLVYDAVMLMIN